MHCLAGLDAASSGAVLIGATDLTTLSDKQMTQLRRDRIGFVFQAFNLVPTLTALENITLPLDIAGRKADQQWLDTVVDRLGLRDRSTIAPVNCLVVSSSESRARGRSRGSRRSSSVTSRRQSRFAFVRGGALDPASGGRRVPPDRRDRHARSGAASFADRVVFLADGQIVDELREPTAESVLDRMKNLETV